MLEEIPTLHKLKRDYPHIFASWICQKCQSLKEETYEHVWYCSSGTNIMGDIIAESKRFFKNTLQSTVPSARPIILDGPEYNYWNLHENNERLKPTYLYRSH